MTRIRKSLTMISHQEFIVPALKTKGKRESRKMEKSAECFLHSICPFYTTTTPPPSKTQKTHTIGKRKKKKNYERCPGLPTRLLQLTA